MHHLLFIIIFKNLNVRVLPLKTKLKFINYTVYLYIFILRLKIFNLFVR